MIEQTSRRDLLKAATGLTVASSAWAAGNDIIRVGLIGCGGRGTEAAGQAIGADKGVRLTAMADVVMGRVQAKRKHLRERFGEQVAVNDEHCFAGFDGYKRVIESSDVVLIATAAKFHPMYMRAAIEAGKHVFVEKPHAIDPAGIKVVREACELAKQKKLSVLSGLQSRYHLVYRETIQRIHDGAIGDIVAFEENFLRAPYVLYPRAPGLTEVEYQASNQYHFHWLSGDDVPQSLVHNLDRVTWTMREQAPVKAHAMGGRSSLKGEIYGDVFDHNAVVYEFANGVRVYAFCRTIPECYKENSSIVLGSKGRAFLSLGVIEGENKWQYSGPRIYSGLNTNPYQIEHNELFKAIRAGSPLNSGDYMVRSTLMGIMGQISSYSGKEVTWEQIAASDFEFKPRPQDVRADMEPPVRPGPDGSYPVPFTPGVSKLL